MNILKPGNHVGNLKAHRYRSMLDYLSQNSCENVLEIGTHKGHTGSELIRHSINKEINYHGVDVFLEGYSEELQKKEISIKPDTIETVRNFLLQYSQNVFLHKGFSQDILPELNEEGLKFGLIWIDGGHSYETITSDFENSLEILVDGGIIFFDDYTEDPRLPDLAVKPFIDDLMLRDKEEGKYNIKILEDYVDDYAGNNWTTVSLTLRENKD